MRVLNSIGRGIYADKGMYKQDFKAISDFVGAAFMRHYWGLIFSDLNKFTSDM